MQDTFLHVYSPRSTQDIMFPVSWAVLNVHRHLVSTIGSVQFSRSVMSYSLWLHGLQHARPPCPSPTPGVHSDSRPLSQWCHPTISSSVVPLSSNFQSFPALQYFPVSQLFASGGQIIGVSASTSVLPMNIQDWSPLGWTGLISSQSKGPSSSSPAPQLESINSLVLSLLYGPLSHLNMTTGKTTALGNSNMYPIQQIKSS